MTPELEGISGICKPEGGWKEKTYYIVDVAYSNKNIIHRAIMYSGFCNDDGVPENYNWIKNGSYEAEHTISDAYYLKVVSELPEEFQIDRV